MTASLVLKAISRRIRGIRDTIPTGYVLGRIDSGDGQVQLLPISGLCASPSQVQSAINKTAITQGSSAGGDLSGTYPNPTVAKLQGRAVKNSAPSDGQVLTWVNANSDWEPKALPIATASSLGVVQVDGTTITITGGGIISSSGGGGGSLKPDIYGSSLITVPSSTQFTVTKNTALGSGGGFGNVSSRGVYLDNGAVNGALIKAADNNGVFASGNWTLTALLGCASFNEANGQPIGIYVLDSVGRIVIWGWHNSAGSTTTFLGNEIWTSLNAYSTSNTSITNQMLPNPIWIKVHYDSASTTFFMYGSLDGINFTQLDSHTASSLGFTAPYAEVGLCSTCRQTSARGANNVCYSWANVNS